tara:strand:- start:9136 stop:9375 length:240 start_codon:yes stop_codon:yes gene_type:complete
MYSCIFCAAQIRDPMHLFKHMDQHNVVWTPAPERAERAERPKRPKRAERFVNVVVDRLDAENKNGRKSRFRYVDVLSTA